MKNRIRRSLEHETTSSVLMALETLARLRDGEVYEDESLVKSAQSAAKILKDHCDYRLSEESREAFSRVHLRPKTLCGETATDAHSAVLRVGCHTLIALAVATGQGSEKFSARRITEKAWARCQKALTFLDAGALGTWQVEMDLEAVGTAEEPPQECAAAKRNKGARPKASVNRGPKSTVERDMRWAQEYETKKQAYEIKYVKQFAKLHHVSRDTMSKALKRGRDALASVNCE